MWTFAAVYCQHCQACGEEVPTKLYLLREQERALSPRATMSTQISQTSTHLLHSCEDTDGVSTCASTFAKLSRIPGRISP